MGKRSKGIRFIKNDIYFIDYQAGLTRRQERIHADSMSAARAIRDERKVELRKQVSSGQNGNGRLHASFDEAWEKLEADLLSDKVTRRNVLRQQKIFRVLFNEYLPLEHPTIKTLNQVRLPFFLGYKNYFVNVLKRNPKGGLRSELIVIKSMMRRLKKLGFCGKDVVEELNEIKRPNSDKKRYADVPKEQLKKLLHFIKQGRPHYHHPVYFMCRTGRRVNETLMIKKGDLEWDGLNPVRINIRGETTKNGQDAPITKLDEELQEVLRESCRRNTHLGTPFLFPAPNGKKCKYDRLAKYLKETSLKVIGIPITCHYFRHRFLTEGAKAGVPFSDLSKICGLLDAEVMQRHYAHATDSGQELVLSATRL